jgi:DnaJ-class molecular chaperone
MAEKTCPQCSGSGNVGTTHQGVEIVCRMCTGSGTVPA